MKMKRMRLTGCGGYLKRRFWGCAPSAVADLGKVTLLIKTFERPDMLRRLLASIDRYYGMYGDALRIIVADDGRNPRMPAGGRPRNRIDFFPLPYDSGLSAGRNYMLDRTETPYFVLLDDDFVFTPATRLEYFIKAMERCPDIDIMGGRVRDKGRKMLRGSRSVTFSGGILKKSKAPAGAVCGFPRYDFVLNFFIARTAAVRRVRWRDEFKVVEHTAFFLDCMAAGMTVTESSEVVIDHFHTSHPEYLRFRRDRTGYFIELLHRRFGIKEIVG